MIHATCQKSGSFTETPFCAVSEEHAGEVVTLKDIQAARRMHRRSLRTTINERVARVVDFLPVQQPKPTTEEPKSHYRGKKKLRVYQED